MRCRARERTASILLSDLLEDLRSESALGEEARVQYLQFRYAVRVRDVDWTEEAASAESPGGFLGATDNGNGTLILTDQERREVGFFVPVTGGGC